MKILEQVFCQCGRGRSFIKATGTKVEVQRYREEWLRDLRQRGWQDIDLESQSATRCNQCQKEKS